MAAVRRRFGATRAPLAFPQGPEPARWSLGLLDDQLSEVRRFRMLAIVGDFARERSPILRCLRVGHNLSAIVEDRGEPAVCAWESQGWVLRSLVFDQTKLRERALVQ
jgi:hypothetical protein